MKALSIAALIAISGGHVSAGTLESFIDGSRLHLSSTAGLPATCLKAPAVSTDIQIRDPELTGRKPRGMFSHPENIGVLQGLAHMSYGFEIGFVLERIRSDQGVCVRISSMEIKAGHETPQIWLRPGLRKNSCEYDVTIEHELQHVQNFHDHLKRFEQSVQRELGSLMRGNGYYKVNSMVEAAVAEERLKSEAMQIVSRLHDRSYQIAESQDGTMDSPAEYRRLSNICR